MSGPSYAASAALGQAPNGRGSLGPMAMETATSPTFAHLLSVNEALLSRLDTLLGRVALVAGALHGHQPPPGRPEVDTRIENGLGIVQTLAVSADRAHETISRIEQQLGRIEQAVG